MPILNKTRLLEPKEPRVEVRPGVWLDRERALYLDAERTLIIADIHWGYADSHRYCGNLLPLWGNEQTARRLRDLLKRYSPRRMVWLGHWVHTLAGAAAADGFLDSLGAETEIVVVQGNHDYDWPRVTTAELRLGNFILHHGDRDRAQEKGMTEIVGHFHPAFSWNDGAGLRLKVPALVATAERLILPAFSEWAAGSPWNNQLKPGEEVWLISPNRIFPLPRR